MVIKQKIRYDKIYLKNTEIVILETGSMHKIHDKNGDGVKDPNEDEF